MRKVMIVGCSGSGKSTLARKLGEKTGLPVIHIDKFYWYEGWVLRSAEETQELIANAIKASEWIFEGNNSATFSRRAQMIDTLVFLDMPAHLCLYRVLHRAIRHRGEVREDMAPGCPEKFDWGLVRLIKLLSGYKKSSWPKVLKLMDEVPPHVAIHHLRNPKSVEAFLSAVKH
jgi:adenylate kinase family enzyme